MLICADIYYLESSMGRARRPPFARRQLRRFDKLCIKTAHANIVSRRHLVQQVAIWRGSGGGVFEVFCELLNMLKPVPYMSGVYQRTFCSITS